MISGLKREYLKFTNYIESILFQDECKKNRGFRRRKEGSAIPIGVKISRMVNSIEARSIFRWIGSPNFEIVKPARSTNPAGDAKEVWMGCKI